MDFASAGLWAGLYIAGAIGYVVSKLIETHQLDYEAFKKAAAEIEDFNKTLFVIGAALAMLILAVLWPLPTAGWVYGRIIRRRAPRP